MKRTTFSLCLLLAIFLIANPAVAGETKTEYGIASRITADEQHTVHNHEVVEDTLIDPTKLIDALTMDDLSQNKYLNRVEALEESLYDVVYECADGTNVVYFFQQPVKFLDDDNVIKDISTSIRKNPVFNSKNATRQIGSRNVDLAKYAYSSEQNAINVYYSDSVNNNNDLVATIKGDYYISLTPISASNNKSERAKLEAYENNAHGKRADEYAGVEYSGAFGESTSLIYNTTYTGIKETIKVDEYTGNNKYSFRLVTGGLVPLLDESGGIILIDDEKNEIAARISQIFIYDSSEEQKFSQNGYYTIERRDRYAGEYIVTLNIDESFMTDESTVFPVYIDPTVNFSSPSSIDDAPVYSGLPNAAVGSNYFNCIGYVDDTYKTGVLLLKFPGLQSSSLLNSLPTNKIHSVTFHAYKVGGGSISYTSTLGVYHYSGAAWNESTVTYNSANINSNLGSYVTSVSMKNNQAYEIDITSAAIAWRLGTRSYDKGLVIKNNTSSTNHNYERDIASTEYGQSVNSNVMPYVQLVYSLHGASDAFFNEEDAARDFGEKFYHHTRYFHIEYGATIYKYGMYYYYINPHYGTPHSVTNSTSVPSGATYVGFVHTQWDESGVKARDVNITINTSKPVFVVLDGSMAVKIVYMDDGSPYIGSITGLSTYYSLTNYEKTALENQLRPIWNNHFNSSNHCNAGYSCDKDYWPIY